VDAFNVVAGNYIGTDATGMYAISPPGHPFETVGIAGGGYHGRIVGNVISGLDRGISPGGNNADILVQGNLIGTDRTGNTALPNHQGIFLQYGPVPGILIGGTTPEARNIITGNDVGIRIAGTGLTIQGNYIGRTVSGADIG